MGNFNPGTAANVSGNQAKAATLQEIEGDEVNVNVNKPRHLTNQNAWYYLPRKDEPFIYVEIYRPNPSHQTIRLSGPKLYRELKAIYEKKVMK